MLWLALWIVVTVIGAVGIVGSLNGVRFKHRVSREMTELWAVAPAPRPSERQRIEALPAPVRRYLGTALGQRGHAVRTARVRHGGTFRAKLDGGWLPIRGEQYFAADPPGFVWWGRVRLAPGLWIDARDRSVAGVGNMLIAVESTFTLADSIGAELDRGALHRLLGEMTWFPTAFLDDRYVIWSALDDRRAQATLRVQGREVAGVFEFGDDGLPLTFSADRYRDVGSGKAVLTQFSGEYADYREIDGVLVPHTVVGYWHVEGQRIPYVRFHVEQLEFDAMTPF